jgi:DNA-binding NarL/FixJ family response regulator
MTAIQVLLVDDVDEVRRDLRTVLTLSGNLEIVGEASNGSDAICMARSLKPDVILMDLEMPVLDGYEATRCIKASDPSCRIIALTIHDYAQARQRAVQAGVDVFVVKGAPLESLISAVAKRKE